MVPCWSDLPGHPHEPGQSQPQGPHQVIVILTNIDFGGVFPVLF